MPIIMFIYDLIQLHAYSLMVNRTDYMHKLSVKLVMFMASRLNPPSTRSTTSTSTSTTTALTPHRTPHRLHESYSSFPTKVHYRDYYYYYHFTVEPQN